MDDGADCNAEGKDWVYNIDLASPSLACKDPVKNCHRHLCECDRQFAIGIQNNLKYFDEQFSHPNFDQSHCGNPVRDRYEISKKPNPEDIITHPGVIIESEARCCGPTTGPKQLYNVNKQECCSPRRKEFFLQPVGTCDNETKL